MKKLLLLIAAGLTVSSVNAQLKQNMVFTKNTRDASGVRPVQLPKRAHQAANKTTDSASGEWFCFTDAQWIDGTSVGGLIPVYPDSNIKNYQGTPGPFYWYLHGIGTSFDPTSEKFYNNFANAQYTYPPPSFRVDANQDYFVDSINIMGQYFRHLDSPSPDTLYIEVVRTGTPGTYKVTWSYLDVIAGRADSMIQIASPKYTPWANAITPDSVPSVMRITKILDAAAAADTDQNGLSSWNFPVGIQVPSGEKVIAFAHFAPFYHYPLDVALDTANQWTHFTAALYGTNGEPNQVKDDWNGGLLAVTDERYQVGNPYNLNNGAKTLAVAYAYTPHVLNDPWFAFKLRPGTVGIHDVTNITVANAYPNPANGTAVVSFKLKEAANVNVSLSNTVGQVIKVQNLGKVTEGKATFDVSGLSNGIYFYTVEANGQRLTNRFVVTH